ncbi:NAC domain-containing protein 67-like [Durio zibethinus]|uniref:NAC domain-containing protein 67-like n=1 Tax=Durio zibethinus TaxID=66656 RepID=A0A6P5XLG6_DURZI|nr:NAC domain-containing protein 67-like [Durio zibethinus]
MEAVEKRKPTLKPRLGKEAKDSTTKPPQPASSSDALAIAEKPKKEDSIVNGTESNDDDDYLDSFPPGYRFCPLDEELVLHYLKKKVMNESLPQNRIMEVNLYRHNPEKLAEQYKQYGEKEWYFFTPRDKKYRNGTRPNRAAGDGYWKATGADREVKFKGHIVGYRKALVFYRGKPPKGDKTNWIMHEYRVNGPPQCKRVYNDMRLDDWVLCRIYKKVDKSIRTKSKDEDRSPLIHHEDTNELMTLDFDYNSVADSMDYSNTIGSFVHQSLPDGSFTNFQHTDGDQFSASMNLSYGTSSKLVDSHPLRSLPLKNSNDGGGQDDIWSVANLDFASQLDFYGVTYVESLINLDNILSVDTPNKSSVHPRMNGRG